MTTGKIVVESIGPEKIEALVEISRRTFREAFGDMNREEDLEFFFSSAFSKEKLLGELSDKESEFFFAMEEGSDSPLAYLKLNFSDAQTDSEASGEGSFEIERLFVSEKHKRHHIGSILMEKALCEGRKRGLGRVWLGVWEKNHPAMGFYLRHGFTAFSSHVFMVGEDPQTDVLMERSL